MQNSLKWLKACLISCAMMTILACVVSLVACSESCTLDLERTSGSRIGTCLVVLQCIHGLVSIVTAKSNCLAFADVASEHCLVLATAHCALACFAVRRCLNASTG